MADDFFNKEEPKEPETVKEEVEKIKLGEEEYTQEELSKLVGLGKTAAEYEEKYQRPISQYYPQYQKEHKENIELREKVKEFEKTPSQPVAPEAALSETQVKEQAIKQADALGLLHKGNIKQIIADEIEGYRLLDTIDKTIANAKEAGKPSVNSERLIEHMGETGIRIPDKAYNDLFETELDKWKEGQVNKIKPEGMKTQETTTAGSKQPPEPAKLTKDNLQEAIRTHFNRGQGKENA